MWFTNKSQVVTRIGYLGDLKIVEIFSGQSAFRPHIGLLDGYARTHVVPVGVVPEGQHRQAQRLRRTVLSPIDHMGGYVSRVGGVGRDAGKQVRRDHCKHKCRFHKQNSMDLQPRKCSVYGGGAG